MNCTICGAPASGGQYCIGCGEPLTSLATSRAAVGTRQRTRPAPGAWLALQEIRLLACPKCGAPNSAARWRCARCGQAFDDRDRDDSGPLEAAPEQAAAVQHESSRWLMLITTAAGVAVVAVAVMMLSARGIGPFGSSEAAALSEASVIPVDSVKASDEGAEGGSMNNVVDGDTSTAWQVSGPGVGEWVELHFAQPVQIDHLLVWNGDQRSPSSFDASSRVKGLVIEFPTTDKVYKVDKLPDRAQNVRVNPTRLPPVTDVIRIRITSVQGGDTGVTAISEIEALARRASPSE